MSGLMMKLMIAVCLSIAALSGIDTLQSLGRVDPLYVLEDIEITEDGELSSIRRANVPALPVTWSALARNARSGHVYCAGRGEATIEEAPDNRWGPVPLNVYVGDDCGEALGQQINVIVTVTWRGRDGGLRATEFISNPFVPVRVK